jgi:hypothetical protein
MDDVCGWCRKPLGESPSRYFCGDACQGFWHAAQCPPPAVPPAVPGPYIPVSGWYGGPSAPDLQWPSPQAAWAAAILQPPVTGSADAEGEQSE